MNEAAAVRPVAVKNNPPPAANPRGSRFPVVAFFALALMILIAALSPVAVAALDIDGRGHKYLRGVQTLGDGMEEVRGELGALRHHMMHHVEEDVIMLKVLFLNRKVSPPFARRVAEIVHENARLYRKDPDLILAIIKVESNFNPKAKSEVGASGLMQVMPQWKKQLGIVGDLTDPATSVKHGLQILGFYEQMYVDEETALSAYNRGPGLVDTDLMRGRDPTRNGYARKVLEVYGTLKQLSETRKET